MRRWWDVSIFLLLVVLFLLAVLPADDNGLNRWLPVGLLAVAGLVYAVVLRRFIAIDVGQQGDEPGRMTGLLAQSALIGLITVAIGANANMMMAQMFVLPLLWMSSGVLQAIIMNLLATGLFGFAYAFSLGWTPSGDLTALTIAVISAAFSLALGLWISRIASWGAERSRLLTELTEAQGELEIAHRDAGAAAERERLAREIHDTIAQSLTSVVVLAQRARLEHDPNASIALIEDTASEALGEARGLVSANAADEKGSDSLEASLTRLADRFDWEGTAHATTKVELNAPLPRELEVVLVRCTQEGLANIRKHSGAKNASVIVCEADGDVVLTIRDDGTGMARPGSDHPNGRPGSGGFGLNGMRGRLAHVGGGLTVMEGPEGGTELEIRFPRPALHDIADHEVAKHSVAEHRVAE